MKKRSNTQFDELMLTIDNTAILAMQTTLPLYEVAHILNETYKYELWRLRDLMVSPVSGSMPVACPLFHFYDDLCHLRFILLDIGAAQHLIANNHVTCNLLFAVSGDDSWTIIDDLLDKINTPAAPKADLDADEARSFSTQSEKTDTPMTAPDLLHTLRHNLLTCQIIDLRNAERELEQDNDDDDLWVVQSLEPKAAAENIDEASNEQLVATEWEQQPSIERPAALQTDLFGEVIPLDEPTAKPAQKRKNNSKTSLAQKKVNDIKCLFKYLEDYLAEESKREKSNDDILSPLIPLY